MKLRYWPDQGEQRTLRGREHEAPPLWLSWAGASRRWRHRCGETTLGNEPAWRYHIGMHVRIETCFEVVPRALEIIRETPEHEIRSKGAANPVSAGDIISRDFIVAEIKKRFPHDEIICEDAQKYPGRSGYTWVCDPLDGTLNSVRGGSPWAVSVALVHGNEILAGCIGEGKSGAVFKAVLRGGAQRNDERIQASKLAILKEALVGFDCPYDSDPRNDTTYRMIRPLLKESGALRCYGSCAVALCLVASGEIDAYVVEHGKPWDFAAGTLIVQEALGKITTWSGEPYDPMSNVQVLASNGALHENIVPIIKSFDEKEIYGDGKRGEAGGLTAFWLRR